MKKLILILLGLTFTTPSAYALKSHYDKMPAGEYRCKEGQSVCRINKFRTGEISFSDSCLEDETSMISKYAPQIKRNQCEVLPDPTKYYICEFADSKCWVTMYPANTQVSCTHPKNKNLTQEQIVKINSKVESFARAGQCRDLYPPEESSKETSKN